MGKGTTDAVSYGKGGNGGYNEKAGASYFKPQMVSKLPARLGPPAPGPLEPIVEVNNNKINKNEIIKPKKS